MASKNKKTPAYDDDYADEPKKVPVKDISNQIFKEVVPQLCNQAKQKLDELKPGKEIQTLAQELSTAITEEYKPLEENSPQFKVIAHVTIMPKDDTSLFEGITCVWENDFDAYKEYKFDTKKYHAKIYVFTIPLHPKA